MTEVPLATILALREAFGPYTRPVSAADILDLARARRAFIAALPAEPPRRDYRTLRRRRKLRYVMRRR